MSRRPRPQTRPQTPVTMRQAAPLVGIDPDAIALAERMIDAGLSDGPGGSIGFEDGELPYTLGADDVAQVAREFLDTARRLAAAFDLQVRR